MIRAALIVAPALLIAGCAGQDRGYPSLAPRATERVGFDEPIARPVPAVKPDPALDARIAELDRQLAAITAGFDRDAAAATRAAATARGKAIGSEAWIAAQTALAQLDDWRAQASSLATDVEAIATERAATLVPPYPAIDALGARAEAEADRQAKAIATIQAGLPID